MPDQNGRVSLRELIELRFDSLDKRLDDKFQSQDDTTDDHEDRIRSLEKRITWTNMTQGAANVIGIILGALGIRNP